MFFINVFSFAARKEICDHAYRSVRRQLLTREREWAPKLRRHGLRLDTELLEDDQRGVWDSVGLDGDLEPINVPEPPSRHQVAAQLESALKRLEEFVGGV
jgi:NTE family protein